MKNDGWWGWRHGGEYRYWQTKYWLLCSWHLATAAGVIYFMVLAEKAMVLMYFGLLTLQVKMWVQLLIPRIEDGNNFGVSIQVMCLYYTLERKV